MAKEDFKQVSSSFETVQCILSSILCPSIFREIWHHCNASPLLCPINAISSSSYVFRLQYSILLHCRIVPVQKLKTLVALERKKPPITLVLSESKRSNLNYIFMICIFMIYDKNTQIFIVFIINHKNTIYIMYLVKLLWWRLNVS
jgi:hypothetical protein